MEVVIGHWHFMACSFENLRVYLAAEELSDLVWDVVSKWKPLARETVGRQLVRAADSIGANIAEGCGRQTYADNRRFVGIARDSLYETRHFLRRAQEESAALQAIIATLPRALNAYLKSIGRSPNANDQ